MSRLTQNLLICFMLGTVLFSGCKKDDDTQKTSLIGMWILKSVKVETFYKGELMKSNVTNVDNDDFFIEFRSDGTFTANFMTGEEDTNSYNLSNDGKYLVDDEGNDLNVIKKLTTNEMVMFLEFDAASSETVKYLFTFERKK